MLDSLVTNAEALTYVKLKIVSNMALLILVAFIFGRLGLKLLWYWTEPARTKFNKWCEKRRDRKYTMECIENLGKEKNILD
jgi:hypothetical protein